MLKRRIRHFVLGMLIISLSIVLIGCKKTETTTTETTTTEQQLESIQTVLEDSSNNSEVYVEGTVYGVIDNGFYMADSEEGRIFVSRPTPWEKDVSIGDVVEVKGTYSIIQNNTRIKDVTLCEVVTDGTVTTVEPETAMVQTIKDLDPTSVNSRGNYYTLTAYVLIDELTGNVTLKDDDQDEIMVNDDSDLTAFTSFNNKRVELNVVVHSYNATQNAWIVSFADASDSIVESPLTLAETVTLVQDKLNIPESIRSSYTLPTTLDSLPDVTLSWSLETNDALTLTDNVLVYTMPSSEVSTVLTCTVTLGSESDTFDLNITVPVVQAQTVSEFLAASELLEDDTVIVSGNVLAVTTSYGYYSTSSTTSKIKIILLQDADTDEIMMVQFRSDDNTKEGTFDAFDDSVQVGDEIEVTGLVNYHEEFRTIDSTSDFVIYSSGNEVTHDTENAAVLDESLHADIRNNLGDYYGKLIKVEDPYFRLSTSSPDSTRSQNWIRVGYDESLSIPTGAELNKVIAFNNGTTGKTYMDDAEGFTQFVQDYMEIPYSGDSASQYTGYAYAYIVNISNTYIQIAIADETHWQIDRDLKTRYDFETSIPTSIEVGVSTIDLPTTFDGIDGDITWTSADSSIIDVTTGDVNASETSQPVELTAAYKINGEDVTSTIVVTVMGVNYSSVDDTIANAINEAVVQVKGIVVGFHWNGSGSSPDGGLLVKDADSNQILYIKGLAGNHEEGTYTVDDAVVQKGDEVKIIGTYTLGTEEESNGRREVSVSDIEITSSGNDYSFDLNDAVVISSQEELAALAENLPHGQLIKFTGGFLLSSSNSSYSSTTNMRLHFDPTVEGIDDVKYDTSWGQQQVFTFKLNNVGNNLGEDWFINTLRFNEEVYNTYDRYPGIPFSEDSEIYAYVSYPYVMSSYTYVQLAILDIDHIDVSWADNTEFQVEYDVKHAFPEAPEGTTIDFPDTFDGIDGSVTWTSSNPSVIDPSTGAITPSSQSETVTLTASYQIGGIDYQTSVDVTIKPTSVTYNNVTDTIANATNNDFVGVKGIVVGFHWNGSNSNPDAGILVKDADSNQLLYVTGVAFDEEFNVYKVNEQVIQKGDEIQFSGIYTVETSGEFTGRSSVEVEDGLAGVTINSSGNAYTFDLNDVVEVSSDADLDNLAENLLHGQLIKITGPFSLSTSSGTFDSDINMRLMFEQQDFDGLKHASTWNENELIFSIKLSNSALNVGNDWWHDELGFVGQDDLDTYGRYPGFCYSEDSVIYAYVSNTLPLSSTDYAQFTILDVDHVDVTLLDPVPATD